MIEFAGIRSDEKYLIVEHYPQRNFPKRKYTAQAIPGGDKDFLIYDAEDAFSNYSQSYSVFLDAKAPGLPIVARGLAEWLLGNPGYQRLEDSYEPDFYRLAYYAGGEQFSNFFNEYGRGTLTFTCAPKRYYKSGEEEIDLIEGQTLYSPSPFHSHPIIKLTGDGDCTLTLTDSHGTEKTFTINNVSGTVTLYSREHKALNAQGQSVNIDVQSPYENLYLDTKTTINCSAYIERVIIIPRWWTI